MSILGDAVKIGEVEVLTTRTYPLDPDTQDAMSTAIVDPGKYPVYKDGMAVFWIFSGCLNMGGIQRQGDGLLIMETPGDKKSNIDVTFPSRRYGPDGLKDLLDDPMCKPGPDQRLRFTIDESQLPE